MISQNGYSCDPNLMETYVVPGTKVSLRLQRGPTATVLLWLASRFDDCVEDIDTARSHSTDLRPDIHGGGPSKIPDDWALAVRNVRGSAVSVSNHASGTAIDVNSLQHPRGVRGTFTAAQVETVKCLLAELVDSNTGQCVVRWGELYKNSPVDGMHFEINAPPDAVRRVADRLENDMPSADEVAKAVLRTDAIPIDNPPNPKNPDWSLVGAIRWLVKEQQETTARLKRLEALLEALGERT